MYVLLVWETRLGGCLVAVGSTWRRNCAATFMITLEIRVIHHKFNAIRLIPKPVRQLCKHGGMTWARKLFQPESALRSILDTGQRISANKHVLALFLEWWRRKWPSVADLASMLRMSSS